MTINAIFGDNGILARSQNAKVKSEVASLIEDVEIELTNIDYDDEGKNTELTVSEKMDKLIERGLINQDRIFLKNTNYKLSYAGNIKDRKGKILGHSNCFRKNIITKENIEINDYNTQFYVNASVIDGDATITTSTNSKEIKLTHIEAPNGYKFAYWINENDDIISYRNKPLLDYEGMDYYIAVFVKESVTVNKKPCVYGSFVRNWASSGDQLIACCSFMEITSDYSFVESGYLRTFESSSVDNLRLNSRR